MANAMEVLGDHKIIHNVLYEGIFIKHYSNDDKVATFIKNYINNACKQVWKYEEEYNEEYAEYSLKWQKWINKGMKKNNPQPTINFWQLGNSQHSIEFKVNHYRQKFWYWKKLKE